jgi:hypothetical protein
MRSGAPLASPTARFGVTDMYSRRGSTASCVDTTQPKIINNRETRIDGDRSYITVRMVAPSSAVSWSHCFEVTGTNGTSTAIA